MWSISWRRTHSPLFFSYVISRVSHMFLRKRVVAWHSTELTCWWWFLFVNRVFVINLHDGSRMWSFRVQRIFILLSLSLSLILSFSLMTFSAISLLIWYHTDAGDRVRAQCFPIAGRRCSTTLPIWPKKYQSCYKGERQKSTSICPFRDRAWVYLFLSLFFFPFYYPLPLPLVCCTMGYLM